MVDLSTERVKSDVCACAEAVISAGNLSVRMMVPQGVEEVAGRLTFWWGVTSSAVALSEELRLMGDLSGVSAVELGCGLGLAGITAALSGATVTFTDFVPEALAAAQTNCRLNRLPDNRVHFRALDWENPGDIGSFRLIVGSEILYDYFYHGALLDLLHRLLAPGGIALLADRRRLVVSRFVGRLVSRGFMCKQSKRTIEQEGFPHQAVSLFRLTRRS